MLHLTTVLLTIFLSFLPLDSLPTTYEDNSHFLRNLDRESWFTDAESQLRQKLRDTPIKKRTKNIIMFLGDGMSIATITAARIHNGQKAGMSGEESSLVFDEFPNVGLAKTYCLDRQVADSACTATAYLGGVKANSKTIGVSGDVKKDDCEASLNSDNHIRSIAEFAQESGFDTGFVTTSRVTHASPAGLFGHTAFRDWESDYDLIEDGFDPKHCPDLATQLITSKVGSNFKVILGGGRKKFLPNTTLDDDDLPGQRQDGQDLTKIWKNIKELEGKKSAYVTNKDELVKASQMADYVLGLFHNNHMQYHLLSDTRKHPRLPEMTSIAIDMLSKGDKGFFLFVEGARIDMAHHKNFARIALDETIEFAEAVKIALQKTGDDTLIVITSDHGHSFSISGNPKRGSDILKTNLKGQSSLPYGTVMYANGPSYKGLVNGSIFDQSTKRIDDPEFRFPSTLPLLDDTHSGEDVAVFARGPWSELFTGVYEQNYIPHAMAFAACIGPNPSACSPQPLRPVF